MNDEKLRHNVARIMIDLYEIDLALRPLVAEATVSLNRAIDEGRKDEITDREKRSSWALHDASAYIQEAYAELGEILR
jgi:hypothetical protein